jgi:hypothetical protein
MKQLIFKISLILIVLSSIFPATGSAVEMSAGIYTWYAWWDFPEDKYCESELDPALLYGPALAVSFNQDFSLTFVFLYGQFDVKETDYSGYYESGDSIDIGYYNYEMKRFDSDIALNYKLFNYFKVYLGAKYTNYSYDMGASDNNFGVSLDVDHTVLGPGAGISITLPLGNDFYFIGNAGGFYLWGKEEESYSMATKKLEYDCKDYGINTGISIAYYIVPASTTINLGVRYQYIKQWTDSYYSEEDGGKTISSDTETSKFYGVTLSATYSFSI